MSRTSMLRVLAGMSCALFVSLLADPVLAGKVVLKSGLEIPGIPINVPGLNQNNAAANQGQNVPQTPYWVVDDGIRRYFVYRKNLLPGLAGVVQSDDSSRFVRFQLKHLKHRVDSIPTWVGEFADVTPWDEHGRCSVTLTTPAGPETIQLAITRLDPRYLTIESTSHDWDFGLTPLAIPPDRLREILHAAVDRQNPDQRLTVVTWLLQSEQYAAAKAELSGIREMFPELDSRVDEIEADLLNSYGYQALREVVERRAIGQHGLARYVAQRILQEDLKGDILHEAQSILDEYAAAEARMAEARMLLASLQVELEEDDRARATTIRSAIERELNFDTLPRLEPFLQNAQADGLPAADKLALAYSGWLLGPAHAKTSLHEALSLWDARFLVLEYLAPHNDRGERVELMKRLTELEGVSVPVIAQMVPQLPPPVEFPADGVSRVQTFELPPTVESEAVVRYAVQTPPEYNPGRAYPAVVLLRPEGRTIENVLAMWGGSSGKAGVAQREGYILIAPDYAPAAAGKYDYGRTAHDVVLRALFDARKRLNIDSDRVFLAGHGMGGDAAFDLGLAHPDLWAGVVPICGQFLHAARLMKENAPQLPFYVVGGERDRNTLDDNASAMALRMQRGWDFLYCEYKQRGFELYLDELPRIFDWMALHRRPRTVREFEHTFVRDFDNRVGWLKWVDLPESLSEPVAWGESRRVPRSYSVSATIPTRQNLFVTRQPGKHTVLWLNPEMVDYEETLKVRVNSNTTFRDYPTPDMSALLEDLRERGDRQTLYWTRLEF